MGGKRMILRANRMCPYCAKEIAGFNERDYKYGSPIRLCKRCKRKYIDPRYHEIAIDGIDPNALNLGRSAILLVVVVVIFLITILLNLRFLFLGYYSPMLLILSGLSFLVFIAILVDILRISTGSKKRHLEKLKLESESRLKNSVYAQELLEAGIPVPDEYLD